MFRQVRAATALLIVSAFISAPLIAQRGPLNIASSSFGVLTSACRARIGIALKLTF